MVTILFGIVTIFLKHNRQTVDCVLKEEGNKEFNIAGFIRDSQMSSMMASSKRFLVSKTDYEEVKKLGEEEYLIEFLLKENTDIDSFATDYGKAGLYANGPAITKPLIRMMNALSDGIMILVIFLVGIGVLLISLLCIRFITALGVEQDRKEVGMLKALGIENKHISFLYLSKYMLFSFVGAVLGLLGAGILERPLSEKLRELYGMSDKGLLAVSITFFACILVQTVILLFIKNVLKKVEKMSTLEALFSVQTKGKNRERSQYVIIGMVVVACMALTLIPQNLYSTISSPQFVTYMGIGDAGIRMDVRQSEDITGITENLLEKLSNDSDVFKYVALKTEPCPAILQDGLQVNLIVETATILMVTHDSRMASRCGRILYLLDGRIQGELILEDGYNESVKKREEKVNQWLAKMEW